MDDVTVWLEDDRDDRCDIHGIARCTICDAVDAMLSGDYVRVQIHAPRMMGKSQFHRASEQIEQQDLDPYIQTMRDAVADMIGVEEPRPRYVPDFDPFEPAWDCRGLGSPDEAGGMLLSELLPPEEPTDG